MCIYIDAIGDHFASLLLTMAEFKHLVVVKFKEDVVVDEILKGLEKLASEIDTVKSFVWYVLSTFLLLFPTHFLVSLIF